MNPVKLGPAKLSDEAGGECAQHGYRLLLDGDELQPAPALGSDFTRQQQLFERGDEQKGEAAGDGPALPDADAERPRFGREEAGAQPEHLAQYDGDGGDEMADPVGQAERVNPFAAVEHDVGQAGTAEEHA